MKKEGFNATPLDVKDSSEVENISPLIYNGKKLPFKNGQFDTALLVTVLHHSTHPEEVLKEAARVSTKLVVKEDIYNNLLEKWLTFVMDSVVNSEYWGHPHSNQKDADLDTI